MSILLIFIHFREVLKSPNTKARVSARARAIRMTDEPDFIPGLKKKAIKIERHKNTQTINSMPPKSYDV